MWPFSEVRTMWTNKALLHATNSHLKSKVPANPNCMQLVKHYGMKKRHKKVVLLKMF